MRGEARFLAAVALSAVGAFATASRADGRDAASVGAPPSTPAPSGAPSPASTEEPSHAPAPASGPRERRAWYGGGILAIDALAFTLPIAALFSRSTGVATAVVAASVTAYVVGGPIVHAESGASGAVVGGSLALRLGLPLLGVVFGFAAGSAADARCASSPTGDGLCLARVSYSALGILVGMVTASAIDIAALSWKTENDPSTPAPKAHALRLAPIFGMTREDRRFMPTFGVGGSF
jgi:hypothetical protein